ncbi:MAG: NADH-quinone oxidoreductase subunit NuoB [Deferrisomatales bacterium]|nr:NADH-quinone oxidoreductase subunit NuoB [Deferrisomatales bacterium]
MLDILRARLAFGQRTVPLPEPHETPVAEGFRGLPALAAERCPAECATCAGACPTGAITPGAGSGPRIDLGRCLFCPECAAACPAGAIGFTREHRLAATSRDDLAVGSGDSCPAVEPMAPDLRKLFGRSFKLRQVSAGGCNGCEGELIVTGTLVYDLSRFGVQFVASPRHADALVVTGPVSKNMRLALEKTYAALPAPKLVIACGACAISGGPFAGSPEAHDGVGDILPVDLWIPGCPPHPWTLVDGVLRLMGRL